MGKQTASDIEFMGQMHSFSGNAVQKLLHQLLLGAGKLQKSLTDFGGGDGVVHPVFNGFRHAFGGILRNFYGKGGEQSIPAAQVAGVHHRHTAKGVFTAGEHRALNCRESKAAGGFADFSADEEGGDFLTPAGMREKGDGFVEIGSFKE